MKNLLPTDPEMFIEFNGERIKIEDLPTANLRADFSYGHYSWHIRTRGIVPGAWPATPDKCLIPDSGEGIWVGEQLACRGCGLDAT